MNNLDESGWEAIYEEATNVLRDLLRMDTTNPPGNEMQAIGYLAEILKREGVEHQVFESTENRGNLVARIPGDGSRRPLLLHGHVDVVTAEPDKWDHDPFGAEEAGGCIYGRGTLDMKNMVAMSLISVLLCKRLGLNLTRDLIFAAVSDEETGCEWGSRWLVENHPDLVSAEYAVGETGGFTMYVDDKIFYPVMVAEKGVCWLRISAKGEPGHGSVPHGNNAAVMVAEAAARLGRQRLPQHTIDGVRQFVSNMAEHQSGVKALALKGLLNPRLSSFILDRLIPDKKQASAFAAMLHNTACPTILKAGTKINVIPGEAVLEVDCRTLPGQSREDLIREVRAIIGDGLEIEVTNYGDPMESPADDPILEDIRDVIGQMDPRGIVIPFIVPGFTDAKYYQKVVDRCYGFSPVMLDREMSYQQLAHGHNERIPVKGFHFGVRALFELVGKVCT